MRTAMLLARDGTNFDGAIVRASDGFRASYRATLNEGHDILLESDMLFSTTRIQAAQWLNWNAWQRGFSQYGLTRSEY